MDLEMGLFCQLEKKGDTVGLKMLRWAETEALIAKRKKMHKGEFPWRGHIIGLLYRREFGERDTFYHCNPGVLMFVCEDVLGLSVS